MIGYSEIGGVLSAELFFRSRRWTNCCSATLSSLLQLCLTFNFTFPPVVWSEAAVRQTKALLCIVVVEQTVAHYF